MILCQRVKELYDCNKNFFIRIVALFTIGCVRGLFLT